MLALCGSDFVVSGALLNPAISMRGTVQMRLAAIFHDKENL
jgi:hypothetical protein